MKVDSIPCKSNLISKHYYLILLALLLFHIINNLIIVTNDNTPLLWDGGDYFYRSLRYYDVFANFDSNFISRFNDVSQYRPPLLMLSSLPLYFVFGRSTDVAAMTNILYLIILVLSVYGIGRRIHSKEVGLMAAFIVSVFPIIFGLSRSYWQDFPLTAMVSLSIYLLIRVDYFRDRKYSILFGLSIGLGMLTKWTYFVFPVGPFLYVFISSLKMNEEYHEKIKRPILNAIIAILVGMVVASFWYIPNGLDIAGKLFGLSTGIAGKGDEATKFQQLGETIGPSGIFNIKSLTFYAGQLVSYQITFIYSILLVIFTFVFIKREDKKTIWIVLLWIVIPVIAFTLIKNKTVRNTVSMLPAVGLIISLGIMNIRASWKRKTVIAIVLFTGLYHYTITSYGSSYLPKRLALRTSIGDVIFFQQYENTSYALYRANSGDWKADEILETINANRGKNNDVKIVLIPRDPFTWMAMQYTSYLKRMPFTFIGAIDYPESVLNSDYVLIKKGGFVAPWFGMDNIHRSLDLVEENIGDFTLIKSVVLPEDYVFLPIYDIKATQKWRKSGVIFSKKIEVINHSVSETSDGLNKEFTVESTLKVLEEKDGELMMVFRLLNKKLDVLMEKGVKPHPPITGWKAGEVKTIKASLIVPVDVAREVFSLEMGFYNSSKREYLKYQPEYLIYKKIGTQ
jgi:4-amino-4-deoxy-L-arabinose transferase-like glycosyltransferase